MTEVFTFVLKTIGDTLVGDTIKNFRDKSKKLGKALIESHSRLSELKGALAVLTIALHAKSQFIRGNLPTLPENKIDNTTVEKNYFYFEDEEILVGMDAEFVGWRFEDGTPIIKRRFQAETEITYEVFVEEFFEEAIRNSYKAMQRAAINLKTNINLISEKVLSVADPKLLHVLDSLAHADALFAYWVFDCAPAFMYDTTTKQLRISLTTFSNSDLNIVKTTIPSFNAAIDMPIEFEGATMISVENDADFEKAITIVGTLQKQIEETSGSLSKFIKKNWKIQDLI
jgi:hypothetical protein